MKQVVKKNQIHPLSHHTLKITISVFLNTDTSDIVYFLVGSKPVSEVVVADA